MQWHYSGNRKHPAEKSVEIITPLIRAFSNPGDLVLDPFLGSGTTDIAAKASILWLAFGSLWGTAGRLPSSALITMDPRTYPLIVQ